MGFLYGEPIHPSFYLSLPREQNEQDTDMDCKKGGVNIIRFGAGPNGAMRTLGQYMLGSGATFG